MDETRKTLLVRVCDGDEGAWKRFADLYQPLLVNWLKRFEISDSDADDLVQEILLTVMKQLPNFSHAGHKGAFRGWLRTITFNRARDFWKVRSRRLKATGDLYSQDILQQLEDPDSELVHKWNQDHDQYILRCLLDLMELEHEPRTVKVFRRVALEGVSAAQVAQEMDMTVGAVYMARSRVLQRLKQEASELLELEST